MKLLLHACCGPCACYPTEKLAADGIDFDIIFFNPNIHPYKEFKRRIAALRELCEKKKYRLTVDKSYPLEECVRGMLDEPGCRCIYCTRSTSLLKNWQRKLLRNLTFRFIMKISARVTSAA